MHPSFIKTTSITSYWQFLQMINWSEPWLIGLCVFHIICLLIIILTRGHLNIQIFIFLGLLTCIYFAEYINQLAAKNWQLFAEDQYFDSNGMFISTVLSFPVIINCCILVGVWLFESICLLKLGIKQFKKARIQKQNQLEKDQKKRKE